ncbi:MAG: M48 family metallopeptidase [Deltaproteobacteria bacterium]|nr:M48 family metallopeptidase [Deltaproteobacteria bacterium]
MKQNQFGGMIYGTGHNGESCQIEVTSGGLTLLLEGAQVGRLMWSAVKVSVTGTDDRYLKFESTVQGEALYILTGNKSIIATIRTTGAPMQLLSQLDSVGAYRKRRAFGRHAFLWGFLGFIALILLGMFLGIKPAAGAVTQHIPTEWETQLGRGEAENILKSNKTCTNPELNAAVSEIGRRLVMGMGKTPYQWQIKVIDVPDVNAFALPGGYVFINRGLIEAADTPDEVAGVLAHEFQHVLARHGMKNVVANIGLRLVVMALIGDMEAVQGFLVDNMAQLAAMQFSRTQESEADMGAVDLAYNAHINPEGFLQFMKKLEEKESAVGAALTIVSTHPGSKERMDDIADKIAQKGAPKIDAFKSDWAAIKTKCDAAEILTPDSLEY